jgi:hypothetical protein
MISDLSLPTWHLMLIGIHIVLGAVGLLTGTVNLLLPKWGSRHRRVGQVFYFSMMTTSLLAVILATLKYNLFLLITGIFTWYLAGTGKQRIKIYLNTRPSSPLLLDYLYSSVMGLALLFFLYLATVYARNGSPFFFVSLLFALIALRLVLTDKKLLFDAGMPPHYTWLQDHIGRTIGAFIAATTAFLVNNLHHFPSLPPTLGWMLPTVLGVPLLLFWIRKAKKNGSTH